MTFLYGYPFSDGVAIIQRWSPLVLDFLGFELYMNLEERAFVVDRKQKILMKFDSIDVTNMVPDPYLTSRKRNTNRAMYGFIDRNGEMVIPNRFLSASSFSEDLARVSDLAEGPRYINKEGNVVISPPRNSLSRDFSEGRAIFSDNARHGYLSQNGEVAIAPRYQDARPFSEGLAAVRESEHWNYIDVDGKEVISKNFYNASSFSDGIAVVEFGVPNHPYRSKRTYGIIDKSGAVLLDDIKQLNPAFSSLLFRPRSIGRLFEGSKDYISLKTGLPIGANGKIDFINPEGKTLFSLKASHFMFFSEGLAPISVEGKCQDKSKNCWGYVSDTGTVVIEPQYLAADYFFEGLAAVKDQTGRWGYIDKKGNWVFGPTFLDKAYRFSNGRALIKLNDRYGYIDTRGELVIKPEYIEAEHFSENLAAVALPRNTQGSE